jgi:hypothetical protein
LRSLPLRKIFRVARQACGKNKLAGIFLLEARLKNALAAAVFREWPA